MQAKNAPLTQHSSKTPLLTRQNNFTITIYNNIHLKL